MRYRAPLLIILLICLLSLPADAGSCVSETDCPKCTIDGLQLVKSGVSGNGRGLSCVYETARKGEATETIYDGMTVSVTCCDNAASALEWYNYHMGLTPVPDVDCLGYPVDKTQVPSGIRRVRKSCVKGLDFRKIGTSTHFASTGKMDYLAVGKYLITFAGDSKYTYEEPNEPNVCENVLARIEKYKGCFAGFSAKPAPTAGEKTLHGNITATTEYGIAYPLKHAKLTLMEVTPDGKRTKLQGTTTDENGAYELGWTFEQGKEYEIDVEMTYSDNKDYFSIYTATAQSDDRIFVFPHTFTHHDEKDLEQDIDLDDIWSSVYSPMFHGNNPYGIMYVHFAEALEFYKDYLKEDIRLNLPLKIVAFADKDLLGRDISEKKAMYLFIRDRGVSHIYISPKESIPESELTPTNREFHEFSHYMMTNLYGDWPADLVKSDIKTVNHDGYVNPSTKDSWEEGFAQFMSTIITEHYGYNNNGACGIFGSLDLDWKAWQSLGYAEEFAVAGVLWDIYDSPKTQLDATLRARARFQQELSSGSLTGERKNAIEYAIERADEEIDTRLHERHHDDQLDLSLPQVWTVIRSNHPDFTSVYQALVKQYPDKKTDIDGTYKNHGFWKDTNPGNGTYDPPEPYRDSNGNRKYDPGEYFIDMPPGFGVTGQSPVFDASEIIGSPSNYQRLDRRTTYKMPGYFVKVNNAVPFYTYRMEFPDGSRSSYSVRVRNEDGQVYIQVPPEAGARITITADSVTTGNPLVFTSDQFHENYMNAVKQGYFVSHDFKVSGPIPTPPVIPDFSKGRSSGKTGTGLFSVKGPLYDLVFGHAESRVPLIVSIPIVIAALLVLAYVLKKEL